MMLCHNIDNLNDLIVRLDCFGNGYIYRGQADSEWKLQSALERAISLSWSHENVKKFEDFSLNQFKSKFSIYDRENTRPASKLSWLSAMQHYGIPTRLLDFTASPYVALYFALENYNPYLKKDISVFAINYDQFRQKSFEYIKKNNNDFNFSIDNLLENQDQIFDKFVDLRSHNIVWITEPEILNVRLDRQAGSFLMSGNRDLRIEDALNLELYKNCSFEKLIISHSLYREIFALLRKMNLNSKSLYGDLDGLARSIRMEMQVYAYSSSIKE
ncbi:FRG domain-containing protein [Acetobacter okinawensis]|uniref:FRG domain-containing protein n=1 Tax=Acetobacter okinawensis TaxID=1076594 RepID=UPI000A3A1A0F|nr:FRG domain-containing protein [Acetobacter okinawensis]